MSSHPPTPKPIRALLVEDDPDDAELLIRELRRNGYEPVTKRVETRQELTAALAEGPWDVVLSDYSMPRLTAPDAFAIVRDTNADVPFIIVSGTVGEDVAVAAMRTGVHDFLLKNHLRRLVAAIEREMREAVVRAERKKIQEQLLISDRMASVGTLAAGVAHEINNPLSVIAGNLQLVQREVDALTGALNLDDLPPEARRAFGDRAERLAAAAASIRAATIDAEESAERVRMIVRDLKVFSRPDEDRRGAVDVHQVLESSLRMAHNEIRHRARIVRRFGLIPKVDANEARLGQVFLNLLINAAHAIPEGRVEDNSITLTTASADGTVTVEIGDTGVGIPSAALPHVFDVFFTTKPIGVGTGLGLSICHRILTAMKGNIEIDSREGKGTTCRVTLPRAGADQAVEVSVQTQAAPAGQRVASVLVIEDEPAIGRMVARLLKPHRVTIVTRARAGLQHIVDGQPFDVILCDVMMPEMTGMDFYAELGRTRPELAPRVVFMSGGAFTPDARAFLEQHAARSLDKPIDVERLRRLVDDSIA